MQKFCAVTLGITLGLFPEILSAQIDPCPLGSLACPGNNADAYFANILVGGAKVAFGGILFAMLIFYGFKLVMGADNDSTISEVYNAYAYAMIGTVLAGGAFLFANTFAVPGVAVNAEPTNTILEGVINGLRALIFISLAFNLFYQGYRLVSSQDEGQAEKAKKQFIYGMIGAAIAAIADRLLAAFIDVDFGILSTEAVGIANFLGTILCVFAVIALFIAGLWLIFAVNEQNKDKAKNIITTVFIVLAVSLSSLALIRLVFRSQG